MKLNYFLIAFLFCLPFQLKANNFCSDIFNQASESNSIEDILTEYEAKSPAESWIENELNFARFIHRSTRDSSQEHPIDIYGEENYKAFRAAEEYLKSIPIGEFQLKDEVLQQTHKLGLSQTGAFKKRSSFGTESVLDPLTDKEVEALKSNKWLGDKAGQHGFFEIPFLSSPNQRRGFIIYANTKNLRTQLEAFYQEMNTKLELAKNKKYDPAVLAAEVHLGLTALRPFADGNKRISRLIMDRFLRELNLPPPVIDEISNHLFMTPQAAAVEIQQGLKTYIELIDKTSASPVPYLSTQYDRALKDFIDKEFEYKGLKFTLKWDGFIYDAKGIPYIFKNDTLYPIADSTYLLYVMSNKNNQLSSSSQEAFTSNYEFLKKATDKNSSVKILPYSVIKEQNRIGKIYLYEWQRSLIKDLLQIDPNKTTKVLDFFGSFKTMHLSEQSPATILAVYEKVDHQLWSLKQDLDIKYSEEIAMVEKARETIFNISKALMRKQLQDMEEKLGPDLEMFKTQEISYKVFSMIYSKSKLSMDTYVDARKNIDDNKIYLLRSDSIFVEKIGFVSQMGFKNILKMIPFYAQLKSYLIALNTNYFNADEATKTQIIEKWKMYAERIKNQDTTAFKLFNQFILSRMPEKYRSMIYPENIEKTFQNLSSLYVMFVDRILESKYKHRGILDQYDRLFIDNYLQMQAQSIEKPGKSFSSNSGLYMSHKSRNSLPFTNRNYDNGIYLVELDRNTVTWNEYSNYPNQYEFVASQRISSKRIIAKIAIEDFKQVVPLEKKEHERLKKLLNPFQFGGSLKIKDNPQQAPPP